MPLSCSHTNPHPQSCTLTTQFSCGGVLAPHMEEEDVGSGLAWEGMPKMGEDLGTSFLHFHLLGGLGLLGASSRNGENA